MWGQPLVLDFSYEDFMMRRFRKACGQQLHYLYHLNRANRDPFNLILCNVGPGNEAIEAAYKRSVNNASLDLFPWTVISESYLNIFPKERLVYLTPHTEDLLDEYSDDDVYIIGMFVDCGGDSTGRPLSLQKAEQDGLRVASLP